MTDVTGEFVATCRAVVELLERAETADRNEFLDRCLILLPALISLGTQLPDFEADDEPTFEVEKSEKFCDELPEWLNRAYSLYHDPIGDAEPCQYAIYLDLGEIYGDLKESLLYYDSGDELARNHALWTWKFQFTWGWHTAHHILSVLPAIFAEKYFH